MYRCSCDDERRFMKLKRPSSFAAFLVPYTGKFVYRLRVTASFDRRTSAEAPGKAELSPGLLINPTSEVFAGNKAGGGRLKKETHCADRRALRRVPARSHHSDSTVAGADGLQGGCEGLQTSFAR
jgi:hypothetical protein